MIQIFNMNEEQHKSTKLTPQETEKIVQKIKDVNKNVYFNRRMSLSDDLFAVAHGINPVGGKFFDRVDGEVGQYFDAHGISKMEQLKNLIALLESGIDSSKNFYTAPFELPDEARAASSGYGTAGGAYKDGIATLTSGYKESLIKDGIKHVFINDVYSEMKEPLSKLFPQYKFHLLSEQKKIMERESLNS